MGPGSLLVNWKLIELPTKLLLIKLSKIRKSSMAPFITTTLDLWNKFI